MPLDKQTEQMMAYAMAAFMKSDWDGASSLFEKALQRTSNPSARAVGKSYLALSLANKGDQSSLRLALGEARDAVRIFGQTSEPPDSVALAHQAIGTSVVYMIAKEFIRKDEWPTLYPEAVEALKKAIKLDPENREARRHLDRLSSVQRLAKMYGAKTGGGCFIATAVYGSPIAPEVMAFRKFRDDVLLTSKAGADCVRFYYLLSPSIAGAVAHRRFARALIRRLILDPLLRLIKN